jgi:hypothetical protein
LINNRQAGRRNRGRNNQSNGRPNGGNNRGGGDNGNRIDNRARGNAAQLHEKYRNLARDSQLSGDRVNVEYYLQFADHYFRVLADNRARQEEQSPQRFRQPQENAFDENNDDFDGDDFGLDYMQERPQPPQQQQREQNPPREQNQQREQNQPREQNQNREPREQNQQRREPREPYQPQQREQSTERSEDDGQPAQGGQRNRNRQRNNRDRDFDRAPQPVAQDAAPPREEPVAQPGFVAESAAPAAEPRAPREARPRRARAAPAPVVAEDVHEEIGLDMAVLPPAISRADNDSDGGVSEEVVVPRKRGRPRRVATEAAE